MAFLLLLLLLLPLSSPLFQNTRSWQTWKISNWGQIGYKLGFLWCWVFACMVPESRTERIGEHNFDCNSAYFTYIIKKTFNWRDGSGPPTRVALTSDHWLQFSRGGVSACFFSRKSYKLQPTYNTNNNNNNNNFFFFFFFFFEKCSSSDTS